MTGTSGVDKFVGGAGDDELYGDGGADSLIGGEGDDTFRITDNTFLKIDGGTGDDDIWIQGNVDLSTVGLSRVEDIEVIDLKSDGSGSADTVTLDDEFIQQATNGIDPISGSVNTLVINGDSFDTVTLSGSFTAGAADALASGYTAYTHTEGQVALVENDVSVNIV